MPQRNIYQVFRADQTVEMYSVEIFSECDNVRRIMQFANENFPGSEVVGGSILDWSQNVQYWGRCNEDTLDEPCKVFKLFSPQLGKVLVVAAESGRAEQYVSVQGAVPETLITLEGNFISFFPCRR